MSKFAEFVRGLFSHRKPYAGPKCSVCDKEDYQVEVYEVHGALITSCPECAEKMGAVKSTPWGPHGNR